MPLYNSQNPPEGLLGRPSIVQEMFTEKEKENPTNELLRELIDEIKGLRSDLKYADIVSGKVMIGAQISTKEGS